MKINRSLPMLSAGVNRFGGRVMFGILVAGSAVSGPVLAADESEFKLEEIVVTAQRREESLQTTPIAVTALTAADLQQQNVTTLADVSRLAPNLSISAAGYTAATNALPVIYIRAVGQQDPSIYSDPGVPVYVDGVYVARSAGGAIDLPDIARVEVLRGPQGTLFGKNAVGGAVNITTTNPGATPGGSFSVSGGSYSMREFRTYLNFGSSETFGVGLALNSHNQDGYGRILSYTTGQEVGRMGDQDHVSGRLRVHWALSESFKLDLSGDYTKYRDTQAESQGVIVTANNLTQWNNLVHNPVVVTQAVAASGKYDYFAEGPHQVLDQLGGGSLTAEYLLGGVTLKSITAYREANDEVARDADGTPAVLLESQRFMHSAQFTQELQALGTAFNDNLSYIAGLYYLHDASRQYDPTNVVSGLWLASAPVGPFPHNPGFDVSRNYNDTQKTDSYAAFGQATYHFTTDLALTAGARYTSETKHATIFVQSPESGAIYVPTTKLHDTWKALTPRLALDYQLTSDLLLYGSVAKGFKSGGFNGRPGNLQSLSEFQPETLWSYEVGMKSEWFEHRLRGNLAAFYSDYKNIQLSRQLLIGTVLYSDLLNVAGSKVQGFELELTALPLQGLEVRASAGYTYNKYTDIQPQAPVSPTSKIPYAPEKTANISVRYELNLGDAGTLTPSVGYSYRSDTYTTPSNTSISRLPSYELFDARLAYKPVNTFWDIALYGKN